jgi:glutamate-1-semialdehyde 2,1-aminomutase
MASTNIKAALDEAHTRYESRYPKSKALYEDALKVLPGGNTRSLLHTNPFPIIMKKGQNHMLIDEDGHK